MRARRFRRRCNVSPRPTARKARHFHPSANAAGTAAGRSGGFELPAPRRGVRGRRPGARRGLLRRGQGRPDPALHGVGVGDLAARRRRDRRAVPVGPALVARRAPRRADRQRRVARRASGRQPDRPADRQHGRDRDRRRTARPPGRTARRARPGRSGRRRVRHRGAGGSDQRHHRHGVDGRRRGRSSRARRSRSGGPGAWATPPDPRRRRGRAGLEPRTGAWRGGDCGPWTAR